MFSVASWNVNSIKARLERATAFVEKFQPDVLCLQELKGEKDKFPFEDFRRLGYQASVLGQKTYNGVGVLSRHEHSPVVSGFEDKSTDEEARFIGIKLNDIYVYSAYIPNGQEVGSEKYQYKLDWMRRLRAYFEKNHKSTDKVILAGDFNVAPEDGDCYAPDAWRGKILFSDKEKQALRSVLEFGFVDTFRLHCKEAGHYSWWDYRQLGFPKNRGLRIDFVFATKALSPFCKKAWIERNERKGSKPSDHAPVFAQFELGT